MKIYFGGMCNTLPTITLIDEVTIGPPYIHYKRTPSEFILYIIADGIMYLTEDTEEYTLEAGDIILLDPSRCHFGRKTSTCHYMYIHFLWDAFSEKQMQPSDYIAEQITERRKNSSVLTNPIFHSPLVIPKYFKTSEKKRRKFMLLAKDMKEAFHKGIEYSQEMAAVLFMQFMYEYSRTITDHLIQNESSNSDKVIDDVLTYLRRYYYEDISSKKIEAIFHMNFDYLNRRFKKITGKTIFYFLNEYRIEQSKIMLKSGHLSNRQIAAETGFCNEYYFSRVFKKYTNLTPGAYKKITR